MGLYYYCGVGVFFLGRCELGEVSLTYGVRMVAGYSDSCKVG